MILPARLLRQVGERTDGLGQARVLSLPRARIDVFSFGSFAVDSRGLWNRVT
jgi:hypothetical protein